MSALTYEEQRQIRIARNRQVLQELGIASNPLVSASQEKSKFEGRTARPRNASTEGERKSRRLQQAPPEVLGAGQLQQSSSEDRKELSKRPPARSSTLQATAASDATELDQHNYYRLRTMSDRALETRIWKIRRVDKLRSFIQILEQFEKPDLANQAREALRELCTEPKL